MYVRRELEYPSMKRNGRSNMKGWKNLNARMIIATYPFVGKMILRLASG
jgi:hypothetical protein